MSTPDKKFEPKSVDDVCAIVMTKMRKAELFDEVFEALRSSNTRWLKRLTRDEEWPTSERVAREVEVISSVVHRAEHALRTAVASDEPVTRMYDVVIQRQRVEQAVVRVAATGPEDACKAALEVGAVLVLEPTSLKPEAHSLREVL